MTTPAGRRVLILSASMGAGHDGAAHELARRLQEEGHTAGVRDFLEAAPLRIGGALKGGYEFELRHVPSAYDATYRFWHKVPWLCPVVAWLVCVLTRRRVLRWVAEEGADLVVSTYPLSTLCIGRLRALGRLRVPAVNFITDFGVHPLWVHKGIDLNLAVHDAPAQAAHRRTGRPAYACGPAVNERFDPGTLPPGTRAEQRRALGLRPGDAAVLVVAGSWGVGDIEQTLTAVAAGGRFLPVVVCGRDAALRQRVSALAERQGWRAVVLGWTDRMPELMSACDALVENAGGLTSFEAMRAGIPVVSYLPIAGHGRDNTAAMAAAGVSVLAADPAALASALETLTADGPVRAAQIASARQMFRADGAACALGVDPRPSLPGAGRRTALRIAFRAATAITALAALAWTGVTAGVAAAADAGAGVAHPQPGAGDVAFIGVRLSTGELYDAALLQQVDGLHATVVVDEATADDNPQAIRVLAAHGITVGDGGAGLHYDASGGLDRPAPWSRAQDDVRAGRAIAALAGTPVPVFVPGRRLTAFDLYDCHDAHLHVVAPDAVVDAGAGAGALGPGDLHTHGVYLINGLDATPTALVGVIVRLRAALGADGLASAPLSQLR